MARQTIDTTIIFTDVPPAQRIEHIQVALSEERAAAQDSAASSWDRHTATRNVATLEKALEQVERNARIRAERLAELSATEQAKTATKQQADQDALEADLRRRYDRAMPMPTSDAEWAQVKDAVLHKHRLKAMKAHEEQVTQMRRSRSYAI